MTDAERLFLASSPEFQKVLAEDDLLRELEAKQADPGADFFELMEVLRGAFRIDEVPVQPLTPALWSFLWAIDNAFTRDREPEEIDCDIALYLLAHGIKNLDCEAWELPEIAAGYCSKCGISYETAVKEIRSMVALGFRPLAMLPRTGNGEPTAFDAVWLCRICGVAAQESCTPAMEVMHSMPLAAVCAFFVSRRMRDDQYGLIHRPTPIETGKAVLNRVRELGEEYLKENYKCQRSEK